MNGQLAVARAFGDFEFKSGEGVTDPTKHIVIAEPEVKVFTRTPADECLILACDGVWDVLKSAAVGKFITKKKLYVPCCSV